MTDATTMQLIFIDLLFLLLAGGLGLWFRAWLGQETRRLDARLAALEKQQESLDRLSERLSSACRLIERTAPNLARPSPGEPPAAPPATRRSTAGRGPRRSEPVSLPAGSTGPGQAREWEEMSERGREAYRRARELLEQGMSTTDVARQVGLGVAEVNVLKRMRDAAR